MTDERENHDIEIVYLGIAGLANGGGDGHLFIPVDVLNECPNYDDAYAKASIYAKKGIKGTFTIGARYEGKGIVEDGFLRRISFGTLVWRGRSGSSLIKEFEARAATRDLKKRQARLEAEMRKDTELMRETAAIRRMWQSLPWTDHEAFMWALQKIIRGG